MPRYNPPPNWPAPPPGWTPPDGWKAPANWPPPPNGWKLWLPDEKEGSWFGRHKVLTGVGGGLAALLLIGTVASVGSDPTPVTGSPASPTASPTVTGPAPATTEAELVEWCIDIVNDVGEGTALIEKFNKTNAGEGLKASEFHDVARKLSVDMQTAPAFLRSAVQDQIDTINEVADVVQTPRNTTINYDRYKAAGTLIIEECEKIFDRNGATEEPTEEPTQAPQPKPMTYSGSGDEVVKFKKALTEPMLITTTWRGGNDNNTIYAYEADGNEGDLLVNTIGSYEGTNIINLYDGDDVKALKIEGSGKWKVTLKPLADAKRWDGSGTYEGRSDDVINVDGVFDGLDSMRFKSTRADGNIAVYGLGENGEDLIVNEIGNFSGEYLVPSGTVMLRISSDGRWEMRKA
jgi:hypothetical protein